MEKRHKQTARWQGQFTRKKFRKRKPSAEALAKKRNRTNPMDQKIMDVLSQYMAECTDTAKPAKKPAEQVDAGGGTYAGAKFHDETVQNLTEYLNYLVPQLHLKEPIDPKEFHTTIVYSRKTVPFEPKTYDPPVVIEQPKGRGYRLELFGPDKTTLVLTYRAPHLQERFDHARSIGATTDYPEYKPHITLAYNATKAAAKGSKWLKQCRLPTFPIKITHEYVEPIDEDWEKNKTSSDHGDDALSSDDKLADALVNQERHMEQSNYRHTLLAYFEGAKNWSKRAKVKKPFKSSEEGLFTKSGEEIAAGLLRRCNGDASKALKELTFYRNRAGKKVSNAGALDEASSILHEKVQHKEEATWLKQHLGYAMAAE